MFASVLLVTVVAEVEMSVFRLFRLGVAFHQISGHRSGRRGDAFWCWKGEARLGGGGSRACGGVRAGSSAGVEISI